MRFITKKKGSLSAVNVIKTKTRFWSFSESTWKFHFPFIIYVRKQEVSRFLHYCCLERFVESTRRTTRVKRQSMKAKTISETLSIMSVVLLCPFNKKHSSQCLSLIWRRKKKTLHNVCRYMCLRMACKMKKKPPLQLWTFSRFLSRVTTIYEKIWGKFETSISTWKRLTTGIFLKIHWKLYMTLLKFQAFSW